MESWLVLSNCQTHGLANSLQMLNGGLKVTGVDVGRYHEHIEYYNSSLGEYDRVLMTHEVELSKGADFSAAKRISKIPSIVFAAYHPDLTYLFDEGRIVDGPLDAYHSMIAFVAHSRGRSVAQTLELYASAFYEKAGYLDRWIGERQSLIDFFAYYDLDIGASVRRWGRDAAFMYSTNHPRIHCIYDMARVFLEREGYDTRVSDLLPHDNLVNSSCFPVYPEIAEVLGVPGSYLFKRCNRYEVIGLRQFVDESFAVYDRHPLGELDSGLVTRAAFERVSALID